MSRGRLESIMSMMQRDAAYFTSQKLQGDWSATDFSKHLTKENLKALLPKYDRLEPLVRVRLLLSVLSLDKKSLAVIQEELKVCLPGNARLKVIGANQTIFCLPLDRTLRQKEL